MQKAWGIHSARRMKIVVQTTFLLLFSSSVESDEAFMAYEDGEILMPAALPPSRHHPSPADAAVPVLKSPVPVSAVPVSVLFLLFAFLVFSPAACRGVAGFLTCFRPVRYFRKKF